MKAPYLTVPGGTTRTPASARFFLVGILSWYSKGPTSMVCIPAIVKYRFIAFITQALDDHSPSRFSATLSSPRSSAATAPKTPSRCSLSCRSARSSKAASTLSLITSASLAGGRARSPLYCPPAHERERRAIPMTLFALVLVLVAATFHATWNLLAKRVGDGGAVFVWLFGALSMLIYAPLAAVVVLVERPHLGPAPPLFMFGSGVLHLGYFVLLQRGYAVGDLSLVYPLARGTGPLLATAAAIVLFDERPSALAFVGIGLITAGVFVLTSESGSLSTGLGAGVVYGLLTGVFIAAYTIWDKQAVSALLIPPLLQSWATILVMTLLLTPVAMSRNKVARALWRAHKPEVIGEAVLSPLSYILVLMALVFTPVSYVAPAREISILIGAAMGAGLLSEGHSTRRLIAAAAMVVGVIALALG